MYDSFFSICDFKIAVPSTVTIANTVGEEVKFELEIGIKVTGVTVSDPPGEIAILSKSKVPGMLRMTRFRFKLYRPLVIIPAEPLIEASPITKEFNPP